MLTEREEPCQEQYRSDDGKSDSAIEGKVVSSTIVLSLFAQTLSEYAEAAVTDVVCVGVPDCKQNADPEGDGTEND